MDSNNYVFSTDTGINSEAYRIDIWQKFQERFVAMLQRHSQVLVVRLLVRFPEEIMAQANTSNTGWKPIGVIWTATD